MKTYRLFGPGAASGCLALVVAIVGPVCSALADARSNTAFVELQPGTSSFWHTATNSTLSLPVNFPVGAQTATLSVSGVKYSKTYPGITAATLSGGCFRLELPAATSQDAENVYDLTLAFDDGTSQRAKLGLLDGAFGATSAATRCLFDKGDSAWRKARVVVMPVPFGVETISVNGVETDTGLCGRQGWYAARMSTSGAATTFAMEHDGEEYEETLFGLAAGFILWYE